MEMWGIDVHAHFGPADGFPQQGKKKEMLALTLEQLKSCYERANIRAGLVSPMDGIFPFGDNTIPKANERMINLAPNVPWMFPWVVIHPDLPQTFQQAQEALERKICAGIKIHPDAHKYKIEERGEEIFRFAAKYQTVIETHSGDINSMPEAYVKLANQYPQVSVILSHLGNGCDGDVTHQVRAIQAAREGNLYTDVSSGQSILFHLVEWAVKEVGEEKIMFGTDAPLHHIIMMKSRIETADISEKEKKAILFCNARKLFGELLTKSFCVNGI